MDIENAYTKCVAALRGARQIAVSSGAGMSAESGVATFRDADGLWSKFDASELATPGAFARDPRKVWAWYRARRAQLAAVQPHAGHRVLAAWEAGGLDADLTVITQNVDGLHHRAGSENVIELHGRLDVVRCTSCAYLATTLDDLGEDPQCPACRDARLRPGVVWFGEALPEGAIQQAWRAAEACDVMLVIGTSGVVQPAASLAAVARQNGAFVIEVNPNETELTHLADEALRAPCGEALTTLDAALRG